MTSPEQQTGKGSTSKPNTEAESAQSSPKAFRPVLGELEARRQAEDARKRAKLVKQKRQKARTEFNAWKKNLCRIIEKESDIVFDETTLTWQFVVPAGLNRCFYEVMIKEYVRAKKAANEGDAAKLVRQEFDDAALEAEKVLQKQHDARQADDEDKGART